MKEEESIAENFLLLILIFYIPYYFWVLYFLISLLLGLMFIYAEFSLGTKGSQLLGSQLLILVIDVYIALWLSLKL